LLFSPVTQEESFCALRKTFVLVSYKFNLCRKSKDFKGRMIFRQNNFVIILPKNYSAYLVPACPGYASQNELLDFKTLLLIFRQFSYSFLAQNDFKDSKSLPSNLRMHAWLS